MKFLIHFTSTSSVLIIVDFGGGSGVADIGKHQHLFSRKGTFSIATAYKKISGIKILKSNSISAPYQLTYAT